MTRPVLRALILSFVTLGAVPAFAEEGQPIPAPSVQESGAPAETATAVFAGGCFWGVQGVFQHTQGVTRAVSGYAGDEKSLASYPIVSSGRTAHAEAVKVTYDPRRVSYAKLLQVFFSVAHDPTQLDRQGPDTGKQYRSAVFPQSDEQARVAKAYIAELDSAKAFPERIVTRIENGHAFYPAEGYHQDYLTLHPLQPYILINDRPKIEALHRLFPDLFREKPVLVGTAALTD